MVALLDSCSASCLLWRLSLSHGNCDATLIKLVRRVGVDGLEGVALVVGQALLDCAISKRADSGRAGVRSLG